MTDRRRFWAEATEAEIAEECRHGWRRVEPARTRVVAPVTDLFATPQGARDRQLLRGQGFIIRAAEDDFGCVWGETEADGYSGWVDSGVLYTHPPDATTHRVHAAQTYAKTSPGLKTPGRITPLSLGSDLVVLDESDGWSRVAWELPVAWDSREKRKGRAPQIDYYVPSLHLTPISQFEPDPVAVAERLLGTPYLWGGNSSFGIDCSGLVQIACHACGIDCPGDSDQQQAHFPAAPDDTYQRGDLLFWRGHVAWVADAHTLIHANAHHMAVAHEPIAAAIARIETQGDGPITKHARLSPRLAE